MLPNGVTSTYDTSNSFIGHHQIYQYNGSTMFEPSLGPTNQYNGNVVYAVVEYSSNTTQTMSVITHEVYEAATDPDGSTGYWDPPDGGETEIGDPCNLQTIILDGYPVQQVWSQAACGCK
jgi:hypothetical protein